VALGYGIGPCRFVTAREPVSVNDTMWLMRTRFTGTWFDERSDVGAGPFHAECVSFDHVLLVSAASVETRHWHAEPAPLHTNGTVSACTVPSNYQPHAHNANSKLSCSAATVNAGFLSVSCFSLVDDFLVFGCFCFLLR
jgi:hypothetical protein